MIKEAVILAGGLGTRLKQVVGELPKSMAPVRNLPFLTFILEHLVKHGIEKIIIAAGYKHEAIESYFGSCYKNSNILYSIEEEPLGTGGAILKAEELISSDYFFVLNGDTWFGVDLAKFDKMHNKNRSVLSVALKPMVNFDRYGNVTVKGERITSFSEKKFCEEGLINGGVYIINKGWLGKKSPSGVFSFEKDIMEKVVNDAIITFYISDTYFIDIGIPKDYLKAPEELPDLIN